MMLGVIAQIQIINNVDKSKCSTIVCFMVDKYSCCHSCQSETLSLITINNEKHITENSLLQKMNEFFYKIFINRSNQGNYIFYDFASPKLKGKKQ